MFPDLPCRIALLFGVWIWIATTPSPTPLLTLTAIFIHEGGHIMAARLCGARTAGFSLDSLGVRMYLSEAISSYRKEMMICAAGPLANLITAALCFPLRHSEAGGFFLSVSLALAILNLLPIKGFDGGRIASCFLTLRLSPEAADRIGLFLSFFCLFILWCISVYQMITVGAEPSLFLFSIGIFTRIFLQNKMP